MNSGQHTSMPCCVSYDDEKLVSAPKPSQLMWAQSYLKNLSETDGEGCCHDCGNIRWGSSITALSLRPIKGEVKVPGHQITVCNLASGIDTAGIKSVARCCDESCCFLVDDVSQLR